LGSLEGDAERMIESTGLRLFAFVVLGALLGFTYLGALRLNVRLYLGPGVAWIALLTHAMRALAIVATLTFCARRGGLALVSSVAGFHVMRTVTINRMTLAPARKS
jgi:hypothetical protein